MSVKGGSGLFLSLELDVRLGSILALLLPGLTTLLAFLHCISTSSSSLLSTRFWLGLFTSFLDFFLGGRLLSWSSEGSGSLKELAVSVGEGGFVVVVAGWNVGDDGIKVVVSVWNVGGGGFGVVCSEWSVGDGEFGIFCSVWTDREGGFGVVVAGWNVGDDGI